MPRSRTLVEALGEAARAGAGYYFLADGVETFLSYADVRAQACGVAQSLRDAGLRRGDLVGLALADAAAFLTALFGASIAGLIPASLYPPATAADLARYIELTASALRGSAARAVITSKRLMPQFEPVRALCPDLSLVLAREDLDGPAVEPSVVPAIDDIAFVQFTSGSTSAPKGVALSHANLCANIDAINGPSGLGTSDADIGVSWLPLNHDMGLIGMALSPVYASRPTVLIPPQTFVKRPAEWLREMSRHRGTISFAPSFAYDLCVRRVKDRDLADLDLSSWRVAGCGAEPIHAPTLEAFASRFSSAGFRRRSFLPCYGLAEHVLAAALAPRGRGLVVEHVSAAALERAPVVASAAGDPSAVPLVGCGHALPGHRLRIVDENDRPIRDRHVGEIVLHGPSVMLGYYADDAQTAETIRGGWLHTGDLGYLSNGELFVCGRAKDTIIVNGRKYYPQDMEWAVGDLPGVRRGRVVAFGVVALGLRDRVVILVESAGTLSEEALTDSIRRRIGDVLGLYIDEIVIVPGGTVGRTTSGKVQRLATKARYERGEFASSSAKDDGPPLA